MRHIAAYLLLQCGGNADPSAADIKKLLGVAGVEADESRLETLISELKGKSIADVRFSFFFFFFKRLLVMVEI